MYPPEIVNPCKEQLTTNGFESLETPDQVVDVIESSKDETLLIVVNSVCGCAARGARPGVLKSLQNEKRPAHLATVFAGVDTQATAQARQFFLPYPPSSPSIALFKEGKLVHFIERHQIEGRSDEDLAAHLKQVYEEYC